MKSFFAIITVLLASLSLAEAETRALLIPLHAPIYAPQIDLVRAGLEDAEKRGLATVFLEIDVPEGEPIHGKEIAEAMADRGELKTVAYIKDRGYAAGALVAIASDEIVMRRGATLGNAGLEKPDEKKLSPLRTTAASYAGKSGRPRRLAEAMVDADLHVVEVKTPDGLRYYTADEYRELPETQKDAWPVQRTIAERGKLLTLDADGAVTVGIARDVVASRDGLYALYQLTPEQVEVFKRESANPAPTESVSAAPDTEASTAPSTRPGGRAGKKVAVIPINDGGSMIDKVLAGFVKRQIEEARRKKVDLIVLDVVTWGGRVDSADKIGDYIGGAGPVPTVALVTRKAISAGAWICVGCEKIYMLKGTNIGSTLPIDMAGNPTGRKMISAVKGKMKALAEKNSHPYRLVEPMVDPDIELVECRVDGDTQLFYRDEIAQERAKAEREKRLFEEIKILCAKGDILNLSAQDAEKYGLSSGTLDGFDGLWKELGYDQPTVIRDGMNWPEKLARFVSSPYICGPLMAIGLIALIIEFITPGFGIAGTAGLLCLGMALWSQYMVENANALEIVLFLVGFIMVAIEIFALPGLGAVGLIGGGLILISMILAYIPSGVVFDSGQVPLQPGGVENSMLTIGLTIVGLGVGLFIIWRLLSTKSVLERLTVTEEIGKDIPGAPSEDSREALMGKLGKALTPLRPAGTADFEGEIRDVATDGDFIDSGQPIEIIRIEGNKIFVKSPGGHSQG